MRIPFPKDWTVKEEDNQIDSEGIQNTVSFFEPNLMSGQTPDGRLLPAPQEPFNPCVIRVRLYHVVSTKDVDKVKKEYMNTMKATGMVVPQNDFSDDNGFGIVWTINLPPFPKVVEAFYKLDEKIFLLLGYMAPEEKMREMTDL
ncbi:MAG TPA: hypothetical protein VD828_03485, partial [Candidatus Nitrosotenuis sp.]|nr:hypothetical protein [Candidatus Nitrosotenuis sp.]